MRAFLAEVHRRDRVLSLTGWLHVALGAAFLAGFALDGRTVLGLNPWVKPLKFALSITVYVWTVAWLLGDLRPHAPRAARVVGGGTAFAMVVEIACIAMQSLRGVPSHFNKATGFDAGVFALMGQMILLNTLLAVLLLALYLTRPVDLPRPQLLARRLGLAIFLGGSAIGGLMVGLGAHAVGVPDGGPGLPFVNWSTEGGDLRAAHALGLHALQGLPLVAWALGLRGWPDPRRSAAVAGLAVAWTVLFVLSVTQALAGRPLV